MLDTIIPLMDNRNLYPRTLSPIPFDLQSNLSRERESASHLIKAEVDIKSIQAYKNLFLEVDLQTNLNLKRSSELGYFHFCRLI